MGNPAEPSFPPSSPPPAIFFPAPSPPSLEKEIKPWDFLTWLQVTWQIVERNQSLHKFLRANLQWNWYWYSEPLKLSTVFKIEHKVALLILVSRTK